VVRWVINAVSATVMNGSIVVHCDQTDGTGISLSRRTHVWHIDTMVISLRPVRTGKVSIHQMRYRFVRKWYKNIDCYYHQNRNSSCRGGHGRWYNSYHSRQSIVDRHVGTIRVNSFYDACIAFRKYQWRSYPLGILDKTV
jgi:hypothetical protein